MDSKTYDYDHLYASESQHSTFRQSLGSSSSDIADPHEIYTSSSCNFSCNSSQSEAPTINFFTNIDSTKRVRLDRQLETSELDTNFA